MAPSTLPTSRQCRRESSRVARSIESSEGELTDRRAVALPSSVRVAMRAMQPGDRCASAPRELAIPELRDESPDRRPQGDAQLALRHRGLMESHHTLFTHHFSCCRSVRPAATSLIFAQVSDGLFYSYALSIRKSNFSHVPLPVRCRSHGSQNSGNCKASERPPCWLITWR